MQKLHLVYFDVPMFFRQPAQPPYFRNTLIFKHQSKG